MRFSIDSLIVIFFFFKQKTAYEMRISDWSSDVCSSDLFGLACRTDDEERRSLPDRDARWKLDKRLPPAPRRGRLPRGATAPGRCVRTPRAAPIGRASCRDRVCQYV